MEEQRSYTVGIRFTKGGKIYHFDSGGINDLKDGDVVIVETSRGWQLGYVAQVLAEVDPTTKNKLKGVNRKATPRDLLLRQSWMQKETEVVNACREIVRKNGLSGTKIISAEYSFDGSRLTIIYCVENEEKTELKQLRQETQRLFAPAQIEFRQIGPRDAAKILGGMGICGLESRCCTQHLTDFCSISIRMAKEQGISLTPTEITGMCGRLRCCLVYEHDSYVEIRKDLPKRNKRVKTPLGEGKVIDVATLRQMVIVEIPDIGRREFSKEEIQVLEGNEPQKKKG